MMGYGFLVMAFFWWLIVAFIAGGGVLIFRHVSNHTQTQSAANGRAARQVLDERLARGEISVDEFERIRAQLDS